jgi:hypothetical protein
LDAFIERRNLIRSRDVFVGQIIADAEPKRSDRVGDVLDQLLAQILKGHAAAVSQVVTDPPRHAYFTALDEPLEPSCDIHAVAE